MDYAIYKGIKGKNGAIQFSLKPGNESDREPGAVFINITSAVGPNKYDWEKKIVFALSVTDIGRILYFISRPKEEALSLVHVPGKGTDDEKDAKTFRLSRGQEYGWLCSISEKETKHMVPISDDEMLVLSTLLRAAVPLLLCW